MNDLKFYAVTCKCGHCDSKKLYCPITFAVMASNGKDAAAKARMIPRVKHDHKDCVLDVKEITLDAYEEIERSNAANPFLRCTSIQMERRFDLSGTFLKDDYYDSPDYEEEKKQPSNKSVFQGKRRIKHPWRYVRMNPSMNMEETL